MKSYCISPNDFYEKFVPSANYHDRVGKCIDELVSAYDLSGTKVLSVGAGSAHEEFHFLRHNMEVCIMDIDESGSIAPCLENMPAVESSKLQYFIGDATVESPVGLDKVNLLYFSSFTPDELRRNDIARNTIFGFPNWKKHQPLHPIILKYADLYLEDNGILIIQSYCGGINTSAYKHRHYLPALDNLLKQHSLTLSEIYRFKETKAVMLYVITKNKIPLTAKTPITRFHGRSELCEPAEKIWPC